MKTRTPILAAATLLLTAAATHAEALRAFDVAEDLSRFVHAGTARFEDDMPAYGNAFVTQGYIYPAGTLDGGSDTGQAGD